MRSLGSNLTWYNYHSIQVNKHGQSHLKRWDNQSQQKLGAAIGLDCHLNAQRNLSASGVVISEL